MDMGTTMFLRIPPDLFSYIALFSSLESIARLCQVCKRFLVYVREDKRLWVQCLRRDVISSNIELPAKYRLSLADASADDVRFWVKTAISLHHAYASGGQRAKVHSFSVNEELETTWSKIIRGCWCLAAMSNTSQSLIGIWRIHPSGVLKCESKFYLPGPVLDGAVDDDIEDVCLAITVAATDPFIQILSISMKSDETCLTPLERLLGARHVLLLKESIVGYATLDGDDTYPLLTDWRVGATIRLCPALYNNRPHILLGDIHSLCHAIGIWRNHIIAVLDYSVEIFAPPSFGSLLSKPADHFGCQSLYFPMMQDDSDSGWVGEAFLKELEPFSLEIMPNDTESSLRVSIRDRSQRHYVLTLIQSPGDLGFSCQWEMNISGDDALSSRTLKLCVGISNEYQLRLTRADGIQYPAILELLRYPRLPFKETDAQCDMRQTLVVSTSGLPILDLTTVMDFDDAAGLLLLGSCRGEVCVIQFSDTVSQAREGLLGDLPPVLHDLASLPKSLIPMNLPYCYYRPDMIYERTVPSIVLEEALQSWGKACALAKVTPPPGWSSDWRQNTSIQNWVFPFPRWRTLAVDQVYHLYETYNRDLRARIGSYGDIVPIMYCEGKHDFVIFKIAQRIYYFNGGPFDVDDEPRIWALPYSEQDLSNPAVLAEIYQNRWRHSGPLCDRHYDGAIMALLKINEEYLRLLDFLKTDDGLTELAKESLANDPRTWLPAVRKKIQIGTNWRWRGVHRPWGDEDDCYFF